MAAASALIAGVDPRGFGARGDGRDDSAAFVTAQRIARSSGKPLLITGGVFRLAGVPLDVALAFDPGALIAGTVTLLGPYHAAPTQQVFAPDADVSLASGFPTTELWPGHFGARGDGTDQTVALTSLLRTFARAAQAGVAHELRLPGGLYVASALTLSDCRGTVIEGAGLGQTVFRFPAAAGGYGLSLVNCIRAVVRGITCEVQGAWTASLAMPAARGATTLQLSTPIAGLSHGAQIVVSSVAVPYSLAGFEIVTIEDVAGTTVTLQQPLEGRYAPGDVAVFPPIAPLRIAEDSSQTGQLSNTNRFEECAFGSAGTFTSLYGVAIDHVAEDANNADHHFSRCWLGDGYDASVLLRGRNVENVTFDRCTHLGAWGIRPEEGASFTLSGAQFNISKGHVYSPGGQQSNKSIIVGGRSEGVGQFVRVDGGVYFDLSVFGFSQQGNTQGQSGPLAASAQQIDVGTAAGFYPGLYVDVMSSDGAVREPAIVQRVMDDRQIELAAPLTHAYPAGAVFSARAIDIIAVNQQLLLSGCFLSFGALAGVNARFADAGGNGRVTIVGSKLVMSGFVADGVAVSRHGNLWQSLPGGPPGIVLINGGRDIGGLGDTGLAGDPADLHGVRTLVFASPSTQTTAPAAGAAAALPAAPDRYLTVQIDGTDYVLPIYRKIVT